MTLAGVALVTLFGFCLLGSNKLKTNYYIFKGAKDGKNVFSAFVTLLRVSYTSKRSWEGGGEVKLGTVRIFAPNGR